MGTYLVIVYPDIGKSTIAAARSIPREWFDATGAYNWGIPRASKLVQAHKDLSICALADNQELLYDSFDVIFLLLLDETMLEHRTELRTTTDYNKNHDEMSDILTMHRHFEQNLLHTATTAINVRKPTNDVVDAIIHLSV